MKKLIALALGLSLTLVCFAQNQTEYQPPASSLLNEKTSGLFENQFDKQFNANPDFGSYDQQFIYGGLGNPRKNNALLNNTAAYKNIMLGYYRPAAKPWSVFGHWGAEGVFAGIPGSTEQTREIAGKTSKTKFTPLGMFLFKKYETNLQFLTGLGGEKNLVVGGQFFLNSDFSNLHPERDFYKTETTYDGDKGTLETWNIQVTTTPLLTLGNPIPSTHIFEIGIPVSMKMGNLENTARFFVNSKITEANGHFKMANKTITRERKITDVTGYTKFGLSTEVAIPVRDREEDRWIFGADFNIGIAGKSKEIKNENLGNDEKEEYKASASGGFNLNAKRLFDFRPADSVSFKIRPGVSFGYNGAHNTGFTAAGVMQDPVPFLAKRKIGSSETTYSEPKQWQSAHQVVSSFEIPMGITVKPEKWICGFVLGATPKVEFKTNIEYDQLNNDTDAIGQRKINVIAPAFTEEHVVGLTFDFAGGVHIDVYATGNLTELDKYTAQVFIPLGQPKAKAPKAKKGAEKADAAKKN